MRPRERLEALLEAARQIASPSTALGQRTRERWRETSGLSQAGIELALVHSFESNPSEVEVEQLLASVEPAKRSLVLLSANVFVGAHRAIALGLAGSERVIVRMSRRDQVLPTALLEACPGLFELAPDLKAERGDVLWAYGRKETLRKVEADLVRGVRFLGHGPGAGAALLELAHASEPEVQAQAAKLVLDTVLFDQRGCLSPRAVLVTGSKEVALSFARHVSSELATMAIRVPPGQLSEEEAAELVRFRDTMTYVGQVFGDQAGIVALSESSSLSAIAPVGRAIHVQRLEDPILPLARIGHLLTTVGVFGSQATRLRLAEALPRVRIAELGQMQRPPFDGPVDRRLR